MDWFSWLSRTTLEPSLVYEYGLAFAHNELEEEDIAYLNHEFLQSMGIAIAKHRLEILKLARKDRSGIRSLPIAKLIGAIKKTKRSLAGYLRALVRREDRALVVVSKPQRHHHHSSRWKRSILSKNRKVKRRQEERLMMLTDGSGPLVVSAPMLESFSSPLVSGALNRSKGRFNGGFDYVDEGEEEEEEGGYWTPAVEERRWDAMFQDLKPT